MDSREITKWAVELQSLAQDALAYCKDPFDIERFNRIREISAEMLSGISDEPIEKVRDIFCCERGYQTPKLDCRASIFQNGKILLVQERDGRWSLPGGWVDVHLSVKENTIKEVWEEAGLRVEADRIIAVQDRDKHNTPIYANKICKIFVECSIIDGEFRENSETIGSGYFTVEELPALALEKVTPEQIAMCFRAHKDDTWKVWFD